MFKIFKKNAKEEKEQLYAGMVVNIDGQEMPVDHLIKNYQDVSAKEAEDLKKKEDAKKNAKTVMNEKDVIDIAGHKVTIGEMISKVKGAFPGTNDKKNESEPDKDAEKNKADKNEEKDLNKNAKDPEDKQEKDVKKEKPAELVEDKKNESEDKQGDKENDKKEEDKENTKENSKKTGEEYFVELQNASNQIDVESGRRILPASRNERADMWKARNSKQ